MKNITKTITLMLFAASCLIVHTCIKSGFELDLSRLSIGDDREDCGNITFPLLYNNLEIATATYGLEDEGHTAHLKYLEVKKGLRKKGIGKMFFNYTIFKLAFDNPSIDIVKWSIFPNDPPPEETVESMQKRLANFYRRQGAIVNGNNENACFNINKEYRKLNGI